MDDIIIEREADRALEKILKKILEVILEWKHEWERKRIPTGVRIVQLGDSMAKKLGQGAGSNSIAAGGTAVFQAQPLPAGSVFPAGTTFAWSSNDPSLSSVNDPSDSTGATQDYTDAAGDTATSASLAVAVQLPGGGAPLLGTDVIAIEQSSNIATGVQIVQLS